MIEYARVIHTEPLTITKWLRENVELSDEIYFDDADLILGDETVVVGALTDPWITLDALRDCLERYQKTGELLDLTTLQGRESAMGEAAWASVTELFEVAQASADANEEAIAPSIVLGAVMGAVCNWLTSRENPAVCAQGILRQINEALEEELSERSDQMHSEQNAPSSATLN